MFDPFRQNKKNTGEFSMKIREISGETIAETVEWFFWKSDVTYI